MEDGGGSRSLRVCGVVVFKGSILCQPFGLYKVNGSIQPWTSVGLCLTTGLDSNWPWNRTSENHGENSSSSWRCFSHTQKKNLFVFSKHWCRFHSYLDYLFIWGGGEQPRVVTCAPYITKIQNGRTQESLSLVEGHCHYSASSFLV